MNFGLLWQLLLMLIGAGATMEGLPVGGTVHTTDVGVPPAYVTWRDGRQFIVSLHVQRVK